MREHTDLYSVELPGTIHELGPRELAALRRSDASDTTKILNLRKLLGALVDAEGASRPFLLSIGERAEALAQAYEDRQLTTQQALAEFDRLAEDYVEADVLRQGLGVDENTFAIYTVLKPVVPDLTPAQAEEVNALFVLFPDFEWDEQQKSRLRTELYKKLRPVVGLERLINVTNTLLRLRRV